MNEFDLYRNYCVFLLCTLMGIASQAESLPVPPCDTASIAYPASSICQNAAPVSPQILGTTGGIFQGSAGLSINSQTGTIAPAQSITGQHFITYMTQGTCPDTTLVFLTIIPAPDASFLYPAPICENDAANPVPSLGDPGGCFIAFGNVVFADSSTGEIDLSASQNGNWLIARIIPGTCGDTTTQIVKIHQQSDASFHYPDTLYCQSQAIAAPVILGQGGGTFWTNSPGIALDSVTGFIDLPNSTLSWPYIHYTSPGPCPDTATFWMVIAPQGDAAFSYAPTSFCQSDPNPLPVVTGDTNGWFYCVHGNAVVNSASGEIDLSASQAGDSILIRYFVPGPSAWCPDSQTIRIRLYAPDSNITINYSQSAYCVTDPDPVPIVTGAVGGIFQAIPQGLAMSSLNGKVNLSASVPGTYSIRYYPPGACSDTSSGFSLTVLPAPSLNLTYDPASVCRGTGMFSPLNLTDTLGQFSIAAGSGLVLDPFTGNIDADLSLPGEYLIHYQSGGVCPLDTQFSFAVHSVPEPEIMVEGGNDTICEGESVQFLALGGDKYEYYYQDSLVRALSANPAFSPQFLFQDLDQIKIRAIYLEGNCEAWDSTEIRVIGPPEIIELEYPSTTQSGIPFPIGIELDRGQILLQINREASQSVSFSSSKQTSLFAPNPQIEIQETLSLAAPLTVGQMKLTILPLAGECPGLADSLNVTILPSESEIFIPGLITPNGDGRNDVWEIRTAEGIQPEDYYVRVYNRSGGEVYRQSGLYPGWTAAGLPDGVYWYSVEDHGSPVQSGGLTIKR